MKHENIKRISLNDVPISGYVSVVSMSWRTGKLVVGQATSKSHTQAIAEADKDLERNEQS